jgi:hypothetical protein
MPGGRSNAHSNLWILLSRPLRGFLVLRKSLVCAKRWLTISLAPISSDRQKPRGDGISSRLPMPRAGTVRFRRVRPGMPRLAGRILSRGWEHEASLWNRKPCRVPGRDNQFRDAIGWPVTVTADGAPGGRHLSLLRGWSRGEGRCWGMVRASEYPAMNVLPPNLPEAWPGKEPAAALTQVRGPQRGTRVAAAVGPCCRSLSDRTCYA